VFYAQALHADDEPKRQQITSIVAAVPASSIIVPAQVLGELFNVLTRKVRHSRDAAAQVVRAWQDMFTVMPTTEAVLSRGMDVAVAHSLAIWDAIILAAPLKQVAAAPPETYRAASPGVTIVSRSHPRPTNCSTTCVADRYVSTSAPGRASPKFPRQFHRRAVHDHTRPRGKFRRDG
jgi:predicted nucleic acid-binding protein